MAAPVPTTLTPGASGSVPAKRAGTTFRDGTYTGDVTDAYYGNVQVQVTIGGGVITNVIFLQYPSDNLTSRFINGQAMPILISEAISAQSAQVDVVSGASATSDAFKQSLSSALSKAI